MCSNRKIETSQDVAIKNSMDLLKFFKERLTDDEIKDWRDEIIATIELKKKLEGI